MRLAQDDEKRTHMKLSEFEATQQNMNDIGKPVNIQSQPLRVILQTLPLKFALLLETLASRCVVPDQPSKRLQDIRIKAVLFLVDEKVEITSGLVWIATVVAYCARFKVNSDLECDITRHSKGTQVTGTLEGIVAIRRIRASGEPANGTATLGPNNIFEKVLEFGKLFSATRRFQWEHHCLLTTKRNTLW